MLNQHTVFHERWKRVEISGIAEWYFNDSEFRYYRANSVEIRTFKNLKVYVLDLIVILLYILLGRMYWNCLTLVCFSLIAYGLTVIKYLNLREI